MKQLLKGFNDFTVKTVENWIADNIQEYIPDKFDTKEKIKKNAEEVALHLQKRGIEIRSVVPANRKDDKVVRTWIMVDTRFNEEISTLTINLKTFNEVL